MRGNTIETVRENIRLVRTRLGLTLGQFAQLAGVGLSTVANLESGVSDTLSDRTISRIALGIGLSFDDLVDPALKDRYRPSPTKSTAVDDDPLTAEFNKLRKRMRKEDMEETVKHMRYLIWKRDNP